VGLFLNFVYAVQIKKINIKNFNNKRIIILYDVI